MTRNELKEMEIPDFVVLILKTKLVQCYNKNTPLAVKLRDAINEVERCRDEQMPMIRYNEKNAWIPGVIDMLVSIIVNEDGTTKPLYDMLTRVKGLKREQFEAVDLEWLWDENQEVA